MLPLPSYREPARDPVSTPSIPSPPGSNPTHHSHRLPWSAGPGLGLGGSPEEWREDTPRSPVGLATGQPVLLMCLPGGWPQPRRQVSWAQCPALPHCRSGCLCQLPQPLWVYEPHLGTWKGPRVPGLTWQDSMPRLWATMTGYPQGAGLVATQGTLGRRPGTADKRPKRHTRRQSRDSWALRG